jgi:hypothetical protein
MQKSKKLFAAACAFHARKQRLYAVCDKNGSEYIILAK